MMDIEHAWQPLVLDPAVPADQDELQHLMQQPAITIIDSCGAQLDDLLASRYPARDCLTIEQIRRDGLGDASVWRHGRWVHYPWSSRLVLGSRSFSPQGEPGGGCLGGVPPVRPGMERLVKVCTQIRSGHSA